MNQRVCEACGDCGVKSNCLSVQTDRDRVRPRSTIHQPSCNKDYTCVDGDCPSFISVLPGTGRSNIRPGRPGPDVLAAGDFPGVVVAPSTSWTVRFLGVGGTGVVTASQILGTAALADGLRVRGLDQTGLAQKGGPVVSDLVMGTDPVERGNKLGDGECDLYLGCDLVVSGQPHPIWPWPIPVGQRRSSPPPGCPPATWSRDPRRCLPETGASSTPLPSDPMPGIPSSSTPIGSAKRSSVGPSSSTSSSSGPPSNPDGCRCRPRPSKRPSP